MILKSYTYSSGNFGKLYRSLVHVIQILTIHAPNVVGRKLGHFKLTSLSAGLLKTIIVHTHFQHQQYEDHAYNKIHTQKRVSNQEN